MFDITVIMVNVVPFLFSGFAIFLFIKAGSQKVKDKKLSLVLVGVGLNLMTGPAALFIGGMATDAPDSTMFDFWMGFWFVQAIPFLILLIGIMKWFIYKSKNRMSM
nr:hypothetical protein [Bacillus sp. 165]